MTNLYRGMWTMTDEQMCWLQQATFEDLIEFLRSADHDEFWMDKENSRMFFARFHDVIEEESQKHAELMLKWGNMPLESATQVSAGVL